MDHLQAVGGLNSTQRIEAEVKARLRARAEAEALRHLQIERRGTMRAERLTLARVAAAPMPSPPAPESPPLAAGNALQRWQREHRGAMRFERLAQAQAATAPMPSPPTPNPRLQLDMELQAWQVAQRSQMRRERLARAAVTPTPPLLAVASPLVAGDELHRWQRAQRGRIRVARLALARAAATAMSSPPVPRPPQLRQDSELQAWQVAHRQQTRLERMRRARMPGAAPPLQPLRLVVGGEVYAWIQCTQPQHAVEDFVVGGHHQHLTPFRGEVLLLPLSVASWLMANRPTEWNQMTVYPQSVALGHDGASGLDTATAIGTLTWGYNTATKSAYFSLDGEINHNDSAELYLDANGQPWLVQ